MTAPHVVTDGPTFKNPPEPVLVSAHPAPPSALPAAPAKLIGTPEHVAVPPPDFYQAAIMGAGIPVVGVDTAGLVRVWNQTAARLFGRSEAEVLGQPMEMLVPAEYRPIAARALQRTIQQRSVNAYEMAFVPPGGKNALHLGVTLSAVLGAGGGQCVGAMAWVRDITNRKALESNLLRSHHMASLGTLAAGVAHHFNNIICGMNAMVDLALSTEDAGLMMRALEMSAEASTRISYITQSLLAFSVQESGEPDLADLTEELLRFADAVEPTLRNKGIELVLDLNARRIAAVPRHRFGQVLHHLLRNAEEALDEVAAQGLPARAGKVTIRTQSQDEHLLLQVGDTGCGISTENLPQIFDPFFTTKGVQGGGHKSNPGLGLSLAHGVVMDLGGHIWADSVPGQGTTLNILLPIVV